MRVETCAVAPCDVIRCGGAVECCCCAVELLQIKDITSSPALRVQLGTLSIDTLQCPAATTAASPLQSGYPSRTAANIIFVIKTKR